MIRLLAKFKDINMNLFMISVVINNVKYQDLCAIYVIKPSMQNINPSHINFL